MSGWVTIESTPVDDSAAHAPLRLATAEPASVEEARSVTRALSLRRHERPVLGSLDAAGVMVQRHAREVLVGSAVVIVPGLVLDLIATTLSFDRYDSLSSSVVSVPQLLGGSQASTGVEEVVWFFGLLISSCASCLVGGYVAALVLAGREGPPSMGAAWRRVVPRAPALTLAWLLGHCWIVLGGLLLRNVSSGARAPLFLLASPLLVPMITMTLLVAPVIVIEHLGPFAALRRAWQLARARFWLLVGFTLASAAVGLVVQYGIAHLPRLAQSIGLVSLGRYGWLIEGVMGQLGRLVSMPLVAAATVLVYLQLRMTVEGMDLTVEAELAFGPTS